MVRTRVEYGWLTTIPASIQNFQVNKMNFTGTHKYLSGFRMECWQGSKRLVELLISLHGNSSCSSLHAKKLFTAQTKFLVFYFAKPVKGLLSLKFPIACFCEIRDHYEPHSLKYWDCKSTYIFMCSCGSRMHPLQKFTQRLQERMPGAWHLFQRKGLSKKHWIIEFD